MGPERTPYGDLLVRLNFLESILYVPFTIIKKSPKLHSEIDGLSQYRVMGEIDLLRFSAYAGHTLVHYLFTSTYQCLEKQHASPKENAHAEFATSTQIYRLAEKYELPALKDLARGEIERVGSQLQVTELLDLLKENYPTPRADDMWLYNYIKSQVDPLLETLPEPTTNDRSGTLSITNFLLRAMVELYPKKLSSGPVTPSSDTEPQGSSESAEKIKRQAEDDVDCNRGKGKKRKVAGLLANLKSEPVEE